MEEDDQDSDGEQQTLGSNINATARLGLMPTTSGNSNDEDISSSAHSHLDAESERRASIKEIMKDATLTEPQRRKSIQTLMDGRRKSSLMRFHECRAQSLTGISSIAANAKIVQDEFKDVYEESEDDSTNDNGEQTTENVKRDAEKEKEPRRKSLKRRDSSGLTSLNMDMDEMNIIGTPMELLKNVAFQLDGAPAGNAEELEKSRPPCNHYERNCSIISPCCGMVFGCRICHDECDQLSPPIFQLDYKEDIKEKKMKSETGAIVIPKRGSSKRGSVSSIMSAISEMGDDVHHNIDRFAIQEIVCRICFTRQSSKTNICINAKCKVKFGEYHCEICNLWLSAAEKPYHCHECGFCRVGGRESFRHCKKCGMCIDVEVFDDHNCDVGKYRVNCPVCCEDLFSSRSHTHEMACGHSIHWHCFEILRNHDPRCPICKKTTEDMNEEWANQARDIADQPLPPDQTKCVDITCNDCESKEENRRWHYFGVQCTSCASFNTVHNIKMTGERAHAYLNALEISRDTSGIVPI